MGELCNNIDIIAKGEKRVSMVTTMLQIYFCGFGGFRWPVGHFAFSMATTHQLFVILREAVDIRDNWGFTVEYISMDGISSNRALTKMLFSSVDPKETLYEADGLIYADEKMSIIQDFEHIIKKNRNSIENSKAQNKNTNTRHLMLSGEENNLGALGGRLLMEQTAGFKNTQ